MGVLIFWIQYIIAGILLYLILRCIYIKEECNKGKYISSRKTYTETDKDVRLKHPLWAIILFLLVFIIPVINLIVFVVYLLQIIVDMNGSEYCKYYCKSFLTKEY